MPQRLSLFVLLFVPACGADPGGAGEPVSSDDTGTVVDTGMMPTQEAAPAETSADSEIAETSVEDAGSSSDAVVADGVTDTAGLELPSELLDLRNWKLTLPIDTDHAGSPDEIKRPELDTYSHKEYFHLNAAKTGVLFRAHCGGFTTSGSGYPRSELREMAKEGTANAAWSPSSGTHKLIVREAITHLPVVKADVVAAQIHDSEDDVIEIRLRDKLLFVEHDGANYGTMDAAYAVGTPFTVEIRVTAGKLEVFYNGVRKVERSVSGSGYYFKAGAYTQSNPSKGDAPTAYGEVVIYDLKLSHE